jgi:hypothetical protein
MDNFWFQQVENALTNGLPAISKTHQSVEAVLFDFVHQQRNRVPWPLQQVVQVLAPQLRDDARHNQRLQRRTAVQQDMIRLWVDAGVLFCFTMFGTPGGCSVEEQSESLRQIQVVYEEQQVTDETCTDTT